MLEINSVEIYSIALGNILLNVVQMILHFTSCVVVPTSCSVRLHLPVVLVYSIQCSVYSFQA